MALAPTSPRLPSPPPPTEIQIGSPAVGDDQAGRLTAKIEDSVLKANAMRRIHPGTKQADMQAGPPLLPLSELDSAFQLQEHLKALHFNSTKHHDADHIMPISRESAALIATPPEGIDRALWLYELCRFLINKCNDLIVGFLFDNPPCSATTCPEMRASEWQFLCAVHESPKSCCAIDYCCHTLDWATNIVTSQKIFPSRLSLGAGDAGDDRGAGLKHLVNIFRRLHRIFAHAWFQHRGVFWQIEGQTGLYVLFKTVCDSYELLPAENYKLPPEAEGLDSVPEAKPTVPSILKSDAFPSDSRSPPLQEEDPGFINMGRGTRRHIRSSPSTGSSVTTVLEADEDDPADISDQMGEMRITNQTGPSHPTIVKTTDEAESSPSQMSPVSLQDVPEATAPPATAVTVEEKEIAEEPTKSEEQAPEKPEEAHDAEDPHTTNDAEEIAPEAKPEPEPENKLVVESAETQTKEVEKEEEKNEAKPEVKEAAEKGEEKKSTTAG